MVPGSEASTRTMSSPSITLPGGPVETQGLPQVTLAQRRSMVLDERDDSVLAAGDPEPPQNLLAHQPLRPARPRGFPINTARVLLLIANFAGLGVLVLSLLRVLSPPTATGSAGNIARRLADGSEGSGPHRDPNAAWTYHSSTWL